MDVADKMMPGQKQLCDPLFYRHRKQGWSHLILRLIFSENLFKLNEQISCFLCPVSEKIKNKSDISLCRRKTRSCRSRVCKVLNKTETENENRNTLGNSNDFSGGQQTNFVKTNYCHFISNNLLVV